MSNKANLSGMHPCQNSLILGQVILQPDKAWDVKCCPKAWASGATCWARCFNITSGCYYQKNGNERKSTCINLIIFKNSHTCLGGFQHTRKVTISSGLPTKAPQNWSPNKIPRQIFQPQELTQQTGIYLRWVIHVIDKKNMEHFPMNSLITPSLQIWSMLIWENIM